VVDIANPTHVPIGGLNLLQGDTIGIYVHMTDPASRLSYVPMSNEITRSTPELSIVTGTGISYNYTNSYFPRDLNGGVYYHHGSRPEGDCISDREMVQVVVSQTELELIADTIIDIEDTLIVTATSGMDVYDWFDGSTDSIIELIASDLGLGIHYIDLLTVDSLGCDHFEQFILGVADLVSTENLEMDINVYPNPTSGNLTIASDNVDHIMLTGLNGEAITIKKSNENTFDLSNLPDGTYLLHVTVNGNGVVKQITKISL
jgi:hypothetical protein